MNNITQNVLQIIAKHKSALLQLVYKDFTKNALKSHKGILKNMNSSMIQVTSDKEPSGLINIRFYEGGTKKIYCIYNKNQSELLSLKAVKALNFKLRKPDTQKQIIKSIKPCLNQEVGIVVKKSENIFVINGLFTDMGINDISIKPAPFFNSVERVAYNAVLNIYNKDGHDVIEI